MGKVTVFLVGWCLRQELFVVVFTRLVRLAAGDDAIHGAPAKNIV